MRFAFICTKVIKGEKGSQILDPVSSIWLSYQGDLDTILRLYLESGYTPRYSGERLYKSTSIHTKIRNQKQSTKIVLFGGGDLGPRALPKSPHSFPDPSSSHSQRRRRPRCPPMRNG